MGKYPLRLFSVLFICTAFIFSVSYFGPLLMDKNKKMINTTSTEMQKKTGNPNTKVIPAQPLQVTVINEATVRMNEVPNDLQTFLKDNSKIEVPAKSSFSLLQLAKKQKLETLDASTLSMIATGIYQAILPTNFTIEERNIGSELPSYVKLGLEAKVNAAENEDLVFSNPNKTGYVLELKQDGNTLFVDVKGAKLPYDYKISMKDSEQLTPETIAQYSPELMPGQSMVTDDGRIGQTIDVYRDAYQGSSLVSSELIANDYYPPVDRVIVQALSVPSTATTDTVGTSSAATDQSGTNTNSSISTNASTNTSVDTSTNTKANANTKANTNSGESTNTNAGS